GVSRSGQAFSDVARARVLRAFERSESAYPGVPGWCHDGNASAGFRAGPAVRREPADAPLGRTGQVRGSASDRPATAARQGGVVVGRHRNHSHAAKPV
ncbi:hypothetical protein, partial [Pseudomonas sp. FEN]